MLSAYDNAHSRLVAWAKILLPLAALALLSTLFLVSDRVSPEDAIPYSSVDVEELARQPRLTAPEFAGVTQDGAALTVSGQTARPSSDGRGGAVAEGLRAELQIPNGLAAEILASEGIFDPVGGQLILEGGVELSLSTGYSIRTETLRAATDRSRLSAPQSVEGQAPFGRIEAGSMDLVAPTIGAAHLLVFNDGVKLIYQP
jgi:lipopolysaccharide export system protein LptC